MVSENLLYTILDKPAGHRVTKEPKVKLFKR